MSTETTTIRRMETTDARGAGMRASYHATMGRADHAVREFLAAVEQLEGLRQQWHVELHGTKNPFSDFDNARAAAVVQAAVHMRHLVRRLDALREEVLS